MGIDKEAVGAEETAMHGNKRAEEMMTEMKGNGDEQGGGEQLFLYHPPHPHLLLSILTGW